MDDDKTEPTVESDDEAEARKARYIESYAEAGFVGPLRFIRLGEGERSPEAEGADDKGEGIKES